MNNGAEREVSPLLASSSLSLQGYATSCLVIGVENLSWVARGKQPLEHICLDLTFARFVS